MKKTDLSPIYIFIKPPSIEELVSNTLGTRIDVNQRGIYVHLTGLSWKVGPGDSSQTLPNSGSLGGPNFQLPGQ